MCRAHALPPTTSVVTPKFCACISVVFHELRELMVGHGSPRNREWLNFDLMRVHLVIKDEGPIRQTAEQKPPTRYLRIAQSGTRILRVIYRRDARATISIRTLVAVIETGFRITERLPRVAECFIVHVLMKQRERKKVFRLNIDFFLMFIVICNAIQHFLHVSKRLRARKERQIPARIVRNLGRIVERVTVRQNRRTAIQMSQHPVLLKPGHMSNFPEYRINDLQTWANQLFVSQIYNQGKRTATRFVQRCEIIQTFRD